MAVLASPASIALAQDECSWKNRASLPPQVQRYLSNIFQKPADRYRPFRFSPDEYFTRRPDQVFRRVDGPSDMDRSKPYFLYQSNSTFPAGLLWLEAGMPSRFEAYLDSSRSLSHYHLAKYDGIDFSSIAPVSFIGFNNRSYPSPDAQLRAVIAMNPSRFQTGKYIVEKANNGCLIATQNVGDRLTALLTVYDSNQVADANLRRRDFLQCRDRHYARFLGLRFWPVMSTYSKSVEPLPTPDHDYSKLPPVFVPPPKPKPVSQLMPVAMRLTLAANDPAIGAQGRPPMGPPWTGWEIEKSEDTQKIIALEGSSDFSGVCRVAMDAFRGRWPGGARQWADEAIQK